MRWTGLYEVLGVQQNASLKEIKSAFKKKALKVHPDVNKAPDAAEKFKSVRHAYQVLSDKESRAEHDRKMRRGFEDMWSDDYLFTQRRRARNVQPESYYGLDDVFRDLGDAFNEFDKDQKETNDGIDSLWEEFRNLGEEFVEFLEEQTNIPSTEQSKAPPPPPPTTPQTEENGMSSEISIEAALDDLKKRMGL